MRDSRGRIHNSTSLPPGDYFVDSDLTVTWRIQDITPFEAAGDLISADDIPALVLDALDSCTRTTLFRSELVQRDHVCVLGGNSNIRDLICSHILAPAWFQDGDNRIGKLPGDIVNRIYQWHK
jgi:hypothetical protein